VSPPEGVDYGLPLAQLEQTFEQIIVPDYLLRSSPQPQRHPVAVLLGGQPGAGKSTIADQLQRQVDAHGGLVWVTWDDFRPYHPDYERLLAEQPAAMPDVTRPAARWWQDRAAAWLRAGRYNTLLEGGFRDPGAVLDSAGLFAEAGYHVHVSALAVPAALSRIGIIERFARQVELAGTGRWTTAASHDGDFRGTVETLRLAHASPAVARISLWTRDGLVHDDRRSPAGKWSTSAVPADVVNKIRGTPLSRAQRTALISHLAQTLAGLERAGLAHPALYEMAGMVYQDLGPLPAPEAAPEIRSAPGIGDVAPPGPAARRRDDPELEL
jgi:UDP-N-acetylglucosamine kinase